MQIIREGGGLVFLPFSVFSFLPIAALSPSAHVGTEEEMELSKAGTGRESKEGLHGSCSELQRYPGCSSPPTPADFRAALPVLLPPGESTPGTGRENRGHSQLRFINIVSFQHRPFHSSKFSRETFTTWWACTREG